jgi:hypothetical protein
MARFNLNFDQLAPIARQAARDAGLNGSCRNPFKSIIVRSVEVLHACEEALRIIADYEPPATPAMEVPPRAAIGCACTEAPRGILFHRYRIDGDGVILEANIVPPHFAKSKKHRERPPEIRGAIHRPALGQAHPPLRARHPQLRSVHLVRHALFETQYRKELTS